MADNTQFTPGPWWVVPPYTYGNFDFNVCAASNDGRVVIARVVYGDRRGGEDEANAALLAQAPTLHSERNHFYSGCKLAATELEARVNRGEVSLRGTLTTIKDILGEPF